ncbi:MAG: YidC/Oxa1 family membrane protein insertase [Ruminococcaceae bacterium]|nr:YidC/Oxa1 family membrane protein insertase [Oscillospiraceae bacterium]
MSIIYKAFGFLMKWCYELFENFGGYAVALLAFSLIVQLILFPFSIKQQKNSQKQAKLRPKEAAIRKKYAGRTDRETQMKMNEEIQKLYQEENFSPLSGCLPLLIQFPILIGLFYVIKSPLSYISGMDESLVLELNNFMSGISDVFKEGAKISAIDEISLIREINNNLPAVLKEFPNLTTDYVLPNFSAFGNFLDLSMTPWGAFDGYPQLIIIPLVTFLSAYFGQILTRKFTYQSQATQEAQSSMKLMNVMMPLFSAYLAFRWPAAMGLYWTYRSILSFIQQFLLSRMFPIPVLTEKEIKEAQKAYAAQNKSKPYKASENQGRKSLIFDDDDDIPELPEIQNTSIVSDEGETEGDSIIPKAPLK